MACLKVGDAISPEEGSDGATGQLAPWRGVYGPWLPGEDGGAKVPTVVSLERDGERMGGITVADTVGCFDRADGGDGLEAAKVQPATVTRTAARVRPRTIARARDMDFPPIRSTRQR